MCRVRRKIKYRSLVTFQDKTPTAGPALLYPIRLKLYFEIDLSNILKRRVISYDCIKSNFIENGLQVKGVIARNTNLKVENIDARFRQVPSF